MNIILFSRKQVKHNAEQLRTILREIERYGMDYVVNEDLAAVIESLTNIRIAPSHLFSGKPQATGDDVMITYGGDGTLLEGVALLPADNIPVVGINCGRLSLLTMAKASRNFLTPLPSVASATRSDLCSQQRACLRSAWPSTRYAYTAMVPL